MDVKKRKRTCDTPSIGACTKKGKYEQMIPSDKRTTKVPVRTRSKAQDKVTPHTQQTLSSDSKCSRNELTNLSKKADVVEPTKQHSYGTRKSTGKLKVSRVLYEDEGVSPRKGLTPRKKTFDEKPAAIEEVSYPDDIEILKSKTKAGKSITKSNIAKSTKTTKDVSTKTLEKVNTVCSTKQVCDASMSTNGEGEGDLPVCNNQTTVIQTTIPTSVEIVDKNSPKQMERNDCFDISLNKSSTTSKEATRTVLTLSTACTTNSALLYTSSTQTEVISSELKSTNYAETNISKSTTEVSSLDNRDKEKNNISELDVGVNVLCTESSTVLETPSNTCTTSLSGGRNSLTTLATESLVSKPSDLLDPNSLMLADMVHVDDRTVSDTNTPLSQNVKMSSQNGNKEQHEVQRDISLSDSISKLLQQSGSDSSVVGSIDLPVSVMNIQTQIIARQTPYNIPLLTNPNLSHEKKQSDVLLKDGSIVLEPEMIDTNVVIDGEVSEAVNSWDKPDKDSFIHIGNQMNVEDVAPEPKSIVNNIPDTPNNCQLATKKKGRFNVKSEYSKEQIDKEVQDDGVFGLVSALVKFSPDLTENDYTKVSKATGITVIMLNKQQIVGHGSWSAIKRAYSMIEKLQKEKKQVIIEDQDIENMCTDKAAVIDTEKNDSKETREEVKLPEKDNPASNVSDVPKEDSAWMCTKCSEVFWTNKALQEHINSVHGQYNCDKCGKCFTKKRYLQTHMKRHGDHRKFFCEVCNWGFLERHKLKLHMESHKSKTDRALPYKCGECGRQFYNKAGLRDHENTHTGVRPYECKICKAVFSHRSGRDRHETIHQTVRKFSCRFCEKGFAFKTKLDAHMTLHTGVSRHNCPICEKSFTVASSLKRHMENCRPYSCPRCNETFLRATSLKTHFSTCSGTLKEITMTEQDIKMSLQMAEETVYVCGVCGLSFDTLEKTEVHTTTHDVPEQEVVVTSRPDESVPYTGTEQIVIFETEAEAVCDI